MVTYFNDFLKNIRLTENQVNELKTAHTTLRNRLMAYDDLKDIIVTTFLQGSYKRATAVRPKNGKRSDVDIVVVTRLDKEEVTPEQALDAFEPFLKEYYDGKYRKQGRSWGIEMTHVDLDIVPTSAPSLAEQGLLENMAVLSNDDVEEMYQQFTKMSKCSYSLWETAVSAYIKDIFEELTAYLKSLLYEAALLSKERSKAQRLLGEHRVNFSAADILLYQSMDDLVMKIAEDIIQALESERSTKTLITKICNKIDLSVNKSKIEEALPYLELRHKLVHTDGKADDDFISSYPMFTYDEKKYITLNYSVILNAKEKITGLVLEMDEAAIQKGILSRNTP